jgi:hypothetical protein
MQQPRLLGFVRNEEEGRALLGPMLEDMQARSLIISGNSPDLRVEPHPKGWVIREYPPFFA